MKISISVPIASDAWSIHSSDWSAIRRVMTAGRLTSSSTTTSSIPESSSSGASLPPSLIPQMSMSASSDGMSAERLQIFGGRRKEELVPGSNPERIVDAIERGQLAPEGGAAERLVRDLVQGFTRTEPYDAFTGEPARCWVLSGELSLVPDLRELDRKSTRLNSSHVAISY